MKILKFKQDDGLCTIALITKAPFGDERVEMIYDVKEVIFVNSPDFREDDKE